MAELAVLTNPNLQKKVVENFLNGASLPYYVLSNNPVEYSASTFDKVVKYKSSAVGGAFNGLAQFNRTQIDAEVRLAFNSRQEYEPIVLDQVQLDKNANDPKASVKIEGYQVDRAGRELISRVGTRLYGIGGTADTTTGNAGIVMEGLRTIDDDGTDNDTIGSLSRTTYTALKSQYLPAGATLSSGNVANIDTYLNNATFNTDAPTHIFTTQALFGIYAALITQTQYTNPTMISATNSGRAGVGDQIQGYAANVGWESLYVRGRAMIADRNCPSTYMFFLNLKNQDALVWAGLKSSEEGATNLTLGDTQLMGPWGKFGADNLGLTLRKSMMSPNQYGKSTDILLMGCLMSFEPRLLAKIKWA